MLDSQGLIKSAQFAAAPVHGLDKHSAREPLAALFYQHRYPVAKDQPAVERNRQLFAQTFGYTPQGAPDFGIVIPANGSGSLKIRFSHFQAASPYPKCSLKYFVGYAYANHETIK